jgi:hypothetical protein
MRTIAPRTGAPEQVIAEEQEEYQPVTVGLYTFLDQPGSMGVLLRYTFTKEEREKLARGEDLYIMQLYPQGLSAMTPMAASVGPQPSWIIPEGSTS